jgi:hypothetical protein
MFMDGWMPTADVLPHLNFQTAQSKLAAANCMPPIQPQVITSVGYVTSSFDGAQYLYLLLLSVCMCPLPCLLGFWSSFTRSWFFILESGESYVFMVARIGS